MMTRPLKLLFVFLCPVFLFAQEYPARPEPPRLVNDFTRTLSEEERIALEQKLVAFDDSTSVQIAIVMLRSLEGFPVGEYGVELYNRWGIGQKGKDNGALILVAMEDRKIWITTGYGMEGAVPDALAKRIIEEIIKPAFRESRYFEGLDQATDRIIQLSSGEYVQDQPRKRKERQPENYFPAIFVILFIVFMIILRARGVRSYARRNDLPFWLALLMMGSSGKRHHGKWGDFSSGRGSFGGFGGGGFGGFGGGRSGGGGAGGSW